jgi:hypothetical protein
MESDERSLKGRWYKVVLADALWCTLVTVRIPEIGIECALKVNT